MLAKIQNFVDSTCYELLIDLLVIANVIVIGLEVGKDTSPGSDAFIVRAGVLGASLFEYFLRLITQGRALKRASVGFDFVLVLGGVVDVFILGSGQQYINGRLWRLLLLRLHRFTRVLAIAEQLPPLKELWLVIIGLKRAGRALFYFVCLSSCIVFGGGGIAMGLMRLEGLDGLAVDEDFDEQIYFGTLGRSCITMFQLITMDGWASTIVRSLDDRPYSSFFCIFFVLVTAYSLMSVTVGVLVWSTVALAQGHSTHADHKAATEDKEIIGNLRDFYLASLSMQDRNLLDLREVTESMSTPQVAKAYKALDLPVNDVQELFIHIDKSKAGEMNVDQYYRGLMAMKMPASTFDIACLSANIGGCVVFCEGLCDRTDGILNNIMDIGANLQVAFQELTKLVCDENEMGQVPEVILRRAGVIKIEPPPAQRPRYTR